MKKTTTLLLIVLVGFTITFTSCKKTDYAGISPFHMYYLGAMRDYSASSVMRLYPDSNCILIRGDQWGTINYVEMKASGLGPGTYNIDSASSNYIMLYKGYIQYTTQAHGGSGVITITKIDSSTHYATATFSGHVIRISDPSILIDPTDTIAITQGYFNIRYQE